MTISICLQKLLILKKEGRLHFPLSAIVFEMLISKKLQFEWDIAPEMSNLAIFGFYLENCKR
jgi:hypothetical protein